MDFVTYTIIVDDIVQPDGRTTMACLGGGGPQTAFGIRLWQPEARIGLAAGVGHDIPHSCLEWLQKWKIDTQGLLYSSLPTLRAWQLFENDGKRTQVWRVPLVDEAWSMLRPDPEKLPFAYQQSRCFHVGVHPSGRDVDLIRRLRASGAEIVSIEPYTRAEGIVSRAELESLVGAAHIFSPNEEEAWSLVGPGPPTDVIARLVELGGQVICLRRGASGAVVHRADTGETWDIPAFYSIFHKGSHGKASGQADSQAKRGFNPSATPEALAALKGAVDQTGCGNSFCGGFLAGWSVSRDLLTSALQASVAASIMIEYEGVPDSRSLDWQIGGRLALLKPYARKIS